ncbi:MAG: hypothetical protein KF868_07100 [Acidobacteria bacterium]|nr:hypothetical protein [Acidobacteriota bacterium]MCW5970188.1 hypothetical protein [Blastocatellales bacterium]
MHRMYVALIVMFTGLSLITFSGGRSNRAAADDRHQDHHSAQIAQTQQLPIVDGSIDPSLIPDIDAHEILFKVLTAENSNDPLLEQRKKSFLRVSGFDEAESAAIVNIAYEYKRIIQPLDDEVESIKMQHWPNPDATVKTQLTQLQKYKEGIVANTFLAPLRAQLSNYGPSEKFDAFITDVIKRKTKGFPTRLPAKQVGWLLDRFTNLFSVSAQAYGCNTYVYIYTNTWVDYYDGYVYCDNYFSAPYDNCGHQYTLSFTLAGQVNPFISLWGNPNGTGIYQTLVDVEGYCPLASAYFGSSQDASQTSVDDYIEVHPMNGITLDYQTLPSGAMDEKVTASIGYGFTAGAVGKTVRLNPGFSSFTGSLVAGDVGVEPSTEQYVAVTGAAFTLKYRKVYTINTGSFKAYAGFKPGTVHVLGATASMPRTTTSTQSITVQ